MSMTTPFERPERAGLPLRDGIGIVLFDGDGRVWLEARRPRWSAPDAPPAWRMPQVALIGGELPLEAALWEVRETTGAMSVEPVAVLDTWLTSELPQHLLGTAMRGRYRGQRQLWFAFRFTGDDREFSYARHADADTGGLGPFETWRWASPGEAIERAPPWQQDVCATVLEAFAETIAAPAAAMLAGAPEDESVSVEARLTHVYTSAGVESPLG